VDFEYADIECEKHYGSSSTITAGEGHLKQQKPRSITSNQSIRRVPETTSNPATEVEISFVGLVGLMFLVTVIFWETCLFLLM
jgi:hypothetical protein